jgi:hypothetical protein
MMEGRVEMQLGFLGASPSTGWRGSSPERFAKRMPVELVALVERIEDSARRKLSNLRAALTDQRDLREVFLALFPSGLQFTSTRTPDGARQVWKISGSASYSSLVDQTGPERVATPTGFEGVFDENRPSVTALFPSVEQVEQLRFSGSDAVATVRRSLQRILLAISEGDTVAARLELTALLDRFDDVADVA